MSSQMLTCPICHGGEELINLSERACVFFDETYLQIVDDMFAFYDGKQMRRNTKFLKTLRSVLVKIEHPSLDDVWAHAERKYSETTKKQNRSWIKRTGWLTGNRFDERFFQEYMRRWNLLNDTKTKSKCDKADADMRHEYTITKVFDYDNTMDVLRKNRYVQYNFPENGEFPPEPIDYDDLSRLQVITIHHVGGNPRIPIPLSYHYTCECGAEINLPYEGKNVHCDRDECGRVMSRAPKQDLIKSGYVSQVVTTDFNNIPVVSLVEIPSGEFNAAVFVQKNKSGYYLFMIAVEEIDIVSPEIDISNDTHVIWQIIARIDNIHELQVGKHIHGLEWYKAAILLSYLANYQRHTSMNTLILGEGGSGKTSIARLYMATLTPQWKMQDTMSLSAPGLYGSTAAIKMNDTTVMIPEAGLLSRYKLVCVDEIYGKQQILPEFRSLLRVSDISKEVAGNRSTMPKNASVIGTSNRIPSVILEQNRWMLKWITMMGDDPADEYAQEAAQEAMQAEWKERQLDWHTGQEFPDMDRWAFIFLIEDPEKTLKSHHLDAADMKINDSTLSRRVYDHSLDNYFLFCSKIGVDWKPHTDRILEFVKELQKHDEIHSKRMAQDITMVLTLSAQINGRAELTDEDFDFVKALWLKTCAWINVEEMDYVPTGAVYLPPEWTIETIKKEIHARMTRYEGSNRFWMTSRGFAVIAGELEEIGAPVELIETTIERYKQNTRQ